MQRSIGYLPENVRLYDSLTAAENLRFFGKLSGVEDVPGSDRRRRVPADEPRLTRRER